MQFGFLLSMRKLLRIKIGPVGSNILHSDSSRKVTLKSVADKSASFLFAVVNCMWEHELNGQAGPMRLSVLLIGAIAGVHIHSGFAALLASSKIEKCVRTSTVVSSWYLASSLGAVY
jgi:hypothetical protein